MRVNSHKARKATRVPLTRNLSPQAREKYSDSGWKKAEGEKKGREKKTDTRIVLEVRDYPSLITKLRFRSALVRD